MDVRLFCSQSAVLVVVGKGGVGKTTASATLARLAARSGQSVLLIELEKQGGLSATLGHRLGSRREREEVDPCAAGSPNGPRRSAQLSVRTLTPESALSEYLLDHRLRWVARRLVKSGTLDLVATAVPGIQDLLVLGQIVELEQAGEFDLIVVDGPAAGHATTFLTSARGLSDSSRAGPLRTRAAQVVEYLSDPARCRAVLETLAEETPVNETVEAAFELEDRVAIHLAPVIVNGVYPRLDHLDAEPEATAVVAGFILRPDQLDAIGAAASFRRHRQEMQTVQATRLAAALPLPQLPLPDLFSAEIGLTELDQLADALERGIVDLREPASRTGRTVPTGSAPRHRLPRHATAGSGPSR